MQKLFNFLIVGFAFVALNVGTVAAQTGMTQPPVTDGMPSCAATSPDFVDNGVCDGSAGSRRQMECLHVLLPVQTS